MIRRLLLMLPVLVLVAGISVGATAQALSVEVLDGRELENLYLISDQSKPGWGDNWSAPIQAATILAWLQTKGHRTLLGDWDDTGVIDVLDAIELADYFGRSPMQADSLEGTSDARLIDTLARYVAARAPHEFELLLYDASFPSEYQSEFPGAFATDMIPGILLTLESEPSFEAYSEAILAGLGVIVGIADEDGLNYYLGGRSFLFEPVDTGVNAVDFAWAREDAWRAGAQGQVLRTLATSQSAWHIEFESVWREVEFMAVLAPLDRPRVGEARACAGPDLAVALADFYCFDDRDGSRWTEAWFLISNVGDENTPECESTLRGTGWSIPFTLPPLPAGGSVALLGPTLEAVGPSYCALYSIEVDSADQINECDEDNNFAEGTACCPPPLGEGCPDLAITVDRSWCDCPDDDFAPGDCPDGGVTCHENYDLRITNLGDAHSGPFNIWIVDAPAPFPDGLAPGESTVYSVNYETWWCLLETSELLRSACILPGPAGFERDDCDDSNDYVEFLFTCEPPPCSDLAVTIDAVECNCEWEDYDRCPDGRRQVCAPIVTVTVENVGGTDSEGATVEVDTAGEAGYSTATVPALASGESATLSLGLRDWYTLFCGPDPVEFDVDAVVFAPTTVDCDSVNNHASYHVICEPPACLDLSIYTSAQECNCERIEDSSGSCDGDPLTRCSPVLIVGVDNVGGVDSGAFAVTAFDGDVVLSLGSSGLPADESEYFRFEFPEVLHCGTSAETHSVGAGVVVADDCDEENNETSFGIVCEPDRACPDLVGDLSLVHETCSGGEPIYEERLVGFNPSTNPPTPIYERVVVGETPYVCDLRATVTVTNTGMASAAPSHASVFDTMHGVSGSVYIGELAPGESTSRVVHLIYVPEDCRPGTLNLELIVDVDGEVPEGSDGGEENNETVLSARVRCT
ncbi:CARDB domain-containing protein [Candidatus Bipolaricaulota bacterium]